MKNTVLFTLLSSAVVAATSYAGPSLLKVQNDSPYQFVLTAAHPVNAICLPACLSGSVLSSGATQAYQLLSPTGSIVFDYDVYNPTKRTGHITVALSKDSAKVLNGLGTNVVYGSTTKISYVPPMPIWEGEFYDTSTWTNNNWNYQETLPSWGLANISMQTQKTEGYLRVRYPAGSANSKSSPPLPLGGAQFYAAVANTNKPVTLSYNVRFPTNFPFEGAARGTTIGKLPGLYGGIGNTGSHVPDGTDGWSMRYMWCDYDKATNKKWVGGGQVLQFTYNSNVGLRATQNGTFLDCGAWSFVPDGQWHNLQQTIHLNDVGKDNGRIDVCYDGKLVFTQDHITFRTDPSLQTSGILFQTFFGGSGESYATPVDTYIDFSQFAIYSYPETAAPGLCVSNVS